MDVVNPRWLLNKRQADILSLAKEVGYIRVEDLANRFKVTSQTIRRDMNILCNERFLSRTHGGAYYTSKEDFDEDLQDNCFINSYLLSIANGVNIFVFLLEASQEKDE